ncbi:hypothetical protein B0H13DRAFT_2475581 [Mycena leptocephala]|nr:hypothetical protein B0H13DRAFT_2475581 [Mycena leptocephala]
MGNCIYLDQALHTGQSPLSPTLLSFQDAADCKDEELQLTLTLLLVPSSSASASTSSSSPSSLQAVPPPLQPRVPALSVTRKTTLPKPPRITTQLNLAWMLQAMGTRPANDTFAVRQPSARRAPVDLTTVQHFTTASCRSFWASPSARHGWLSDSTRTLNLLSSDLAAVEFYDVRFCLWTRVNLTFTHILTSNTYLLLHRIGVSGLDEDRLIDHFVHLPGPQHICYNVAVEQAAVHNKIKAREMQGTDNNNIEVVKVNGIKIEPIDKPVQSPIADADVVEVMDCPPPRMKHPSLSIVIGGASTAAANPICLDDDITPSSTTSSASALFSAFPSSSPSTTPPASPFVWPSNLNVLQSSSATSSMLATSGAPLKWPAGMYMVNMAQGFLRLEAVDMQHIPLAECFQQVFKTSSEFKQQTYTDTQLQWTRGLESLRTEALDVGRTKAGLWSLYAAQVPLKK